MLGREWIASSTFLNMDGIRLVVECGIGDVNIRLKFFLRNVGQRRVIHSFKEGQCTHLAIKLSIQIEGW